MADHQQIDDLDKKILTLLVKDGKMPYTDIAKQLFVSSGTIHVRMKKMEQLGVVRGSSLQLDYSKLGYDILAYLGIFLDQAVRYDDVVARLAKVPEIVEVNNTTGQYNIFARIICKDTNHLRQILHEEIQNIEGVLRTELLISLDQPVSRSLVFG